MAIVKMNKLNVIGLDNVKTSLIKELMDLGVVEVSSQDSKLTDPDWISYIEKDGNENEVISYEAKIAKIGQVLESLDKYDRTKKPMFKTRRDVLYKDYENAVQNKDEIEKNIDYILGLNTRFNDLSSEQNKLETSILSLKPWISYKIPLEITETKYTYIFIGIVPSIVDIDKLKTDIDEKTDKCYIDVLTGDKDQYYLSIICLKDEKEDIYDILKQFGFNNVMFRDLTGTVSENIVSYEKRINEITESKKTLEEEISKCVYLNSDIQLYYDYLAIEKDKVVVLGRMLKTEKTFYFTGWIPVKGKEKVENILKENECWYEISEPEDDDQVPVLLKNSSLIEPLEAVTELYSLPSYSNIDPTASMWFFFILFFGMMFGDVGYGLILVIACGLILKSNKIEGVLGKMLKTMFLAGISTIFWGVMFGSWFGDAIPAAAKVLFNIDFAIKPVWLNPLEEPMTVLIVSFALGLIHLLVGLGVKAYMLIRDGHPLDALFDVGFWYLFIIGPILLLAGGMIAPGAAAAGKWITIVGAAGLILTQGRAKEGIISKLISGILSLYGITGYLSDILSYSRLLALGLATGVVSSVLSIIGSMGGHTIVGIILFIVVFLFGHSFNFAINVLGAFVHSARLQYVEFFGKFYEGGGEPFNPLAKNTKYIKIIKEEN